MPQAFCGMAQTEEPTMFTTIVVLAVLAIAVHVLEVAELSPTECAALHCDLAP